MSKAKTLFWLVQPKQTSNLKPQIRTIEVQSYGMIDQKLDKLTNFDVVLLRLSRTPSLQSSEIMKSDCGKR